MSLLKNIDELENVENLTHRAVLKAIRDTSFSMKEIAFHMKLGRTFIYYIVRRYLPQGYLQRRAQLLELQSMSRIAEERSKAEDRVLIVPAIDNKLSGESHRNEVTSDQKEQDRHPFPSIPNTAAQPDCSSASPQTVRNRVSLEYGDFKLCWEGDLDSRQVENVCGIMNGFLSYFGEKR